MGVRTPGTELPARAERIRDELARGGASQVEAEPHPDSDLAAVHDPALLAYLEAAWETGAPPASPTTPARTGSCPTSSRTRA